MGTVAGAQQILAGLKEAGIDLVSSVPDINMLQLINLLYEDKQIAHVPVGREEEGVGVCAGAHLGGKKPALLMQNGGLLNSCNGSRRRRCSSACRSCCSSITPAISATTHFTWSGWSPSRCSRVWASNISSCAIRPKSNKISPAQ